MSDTSTDTSTIDEKKSNTNTYNSSNFMSDIKSFITSLITAILIILLYFSSSGAILFLCKLAQTNILPTESNCAPYTNVEPSIERIKTNIFTTFTDPEMSMKLEIPYDMNSTNQFIDILREYKGKPSSHFLLNYFISITESLLQFNYSAINSVMNMMNSTLPESVIIGLGPIITGFVYGIGLLLNTLYFVYLWFSHMSWFFKTNANDTGNGVPKWEDVTIASPVAFSCAVGLILLFAICLLIGFPLLSLIPVLLYHKSILSSLFYKGLLNGKQISVFSIIIDVLKYYKLSIVSLICFFVISLAFAKLGPGLGVISLLTVGVIYFGVVSVDLFYPIAETNLTPAVSYKQAKKTCASKEGSKEKHGFLYNMLIGQKGGNISRELKKISKQLSEM